MTFVGELVNKGSADASGLQVAISLLDEAGNTVASGQATTMGVFILKAGERTVWSAVIAGKPAAWKDQRVQVGGVVASSAYTASFADGLTVTGVTLAPPTATSPFVTASGQVQNGGASVAKFPTVTIGLYDASGKLVAVGLAATGLQEVAPGAAAPFTITFFNAKELPAKHTAYAKGSK